MILGALRASFVSLRMVTPNGRGYYMTALRASRTKPAERAADLECGGERSATPLWIDSIIQSAVAVPTSRDSPNALGPMPRFRTD
jgi:hypothetical protein